MILVEDMSKLEEKILNKIKNKKEIKTNKESRNFYSLINLAWMFLVPLLLGGVICKFFIDNTTLATVIMALSMLCGVYCVIKTINDVYKDKQ